MELTSGSMRSTSSSRACSSPAWARRTSSSSSPSSAPGLGAPSTCRSSAATTSSSPRRCAASASAFLAAARLSSINAILPCTAGVSPRIQPGEDGSHNWPDYNKGPSELGEWHLRRPHREEACCAAALTVPAVALDGLADGNFPATDGSTSARHFTGPRVHHQVLSVVSGRPAVKWELGALVARRSRRVWVSGSLVGSQQAVDPGLVEIGIAASVADQLVWRPILDDAPLVEHEDTVGDLHGGQAVGDDDGGTVGEDGA